MGRVMMLTGVSRRRCDVLVELGPPPPPDVGLASLRCLAEQLASLAEHWDVEPGCELHVDLCMAMSLARWPGWHWH